MASGEISSAVRSVEPLSLSPTLIQASPPVAPVPSSVAPALDASSLVPGVLPTIAAVSNSPLVLRSPFTDFTGRCFLKFCLWVDMVASFRRTHRAVHTSNVPFTEYLRERLHLTSRMYQWLGTASCIVAAAGLTFLFYASSFKNLLPFAFLGVIVLVATVFGREAGVLGTLTAALIFASVLFEPRPSLAMQDPVAQSHVIWMIVIGVVVSDLIGRHKLAHSGPVSIEKSRQN